MRFYNLSSSTEFFTCTTAILDCVHSETGGIYAPAEFPPATHSFLYRNPPPSFRETAVMVAKAFTHPDLDDNQVMSVVAHAFRSSLMVSPIAPATYVLNLAKGSTGFFTDFITPFVIELSRTLSATTPAAYIAAVSGHDILSAATAFAQYPESFGIVVYPHHSLTPEQAGYIASLPPHVQCVGVQANYKECVQYVSRIVHEFPAHQQAVLIDRRNFGATLAQTAYMLYASLLVYNRSEYDCKIENPDIIVVLESDSMQQIESILLAKRMGAPIQGVVLVTRKKALLNTLFKTQAAQPEKDADKQEQKNFCCFDRLVSMYEHEPLKKFILGVAVQDDADVLAIRTCHERTGYIFDPSGALAWKTWDALAHGRIYIRSPEHADNQSAVTNAPEKWISLFAKKKTAALIIQPSHPALSAQTVKQAIGRQSSTPRHIENLIKHDGVIDPPLTSYDELKQSLQTIGYLKKVR